MKSKQKKRFNPMISDFTQDSLGSAIGNLAEQINDAQKLFFILMK